MILVPAAMLAEQRRHVAVSMLVGQMSLAEARRREKARHEASARALTGRNQIWCLDYAMFTTVDGDYWRISGVSDWWSKYEFPWVIAPAWEQSSAVRAVALAVAETVHLEGAPLSHLLRRDPRTGEPITLKLIARGDVGFANRPFGRFASTYPELDLMRTWHDRRAEGVANARGFVALKSERLDGNPAVSGPWLREVAALYRQQFNGSRPHEALGGNQPLTRHLGYAEIDGVLYGVRRR